MDSFFSYTEIYVHKTKQNKTKNKQTKDFVLLLKLN